jgi:hypothetical protein
MKLPTIGVPYDEELLDTEKLTISTMGVPLARAQISNVGAALLNIFCITATFPDSGTSKQSRKEDVMEFEIEASRDDLSELPRLMIRPRNDWLFVGSTNSWSEVWPFACHGHTQGEMRAAVQGLNPIVDIVASYLREVKPGGGRFFVDMTGAYYRDASSTLVPFVRFRLY